MSVLEPRQENFCQHFVLDPNATRAAMAAGYSPHTARQQGCRILRRPRIVARIAAIRNDMAREHCIDPGTLMGKLEAVFRRAMEDHAFAAAARAIELQAKFAGLHPANTRGEDASPAANQFREISASRRA